MRLFSCGAWAAIAVLTAGLSAPQAKCDEARDVVLTSVYSPNPYEDVVSSNRDDAPAEPGSYENGAGLAPFDATPSIQAPRPVTPGEALRTYNNYRTSPTGNAETAQGPEACNLDAPCSCNSGCDCDHDCDCGPVWTIEAGALIMQRGRPRSAQLWADQFTGAALTNASIFDFGWRTGLEGSIQRHFGDDAIEARYFGIDAWISNRALPTATIVDGVFGSILLTNTTASYGSQLFSTELNWRHRSGGMVTWLAGFRWVQLSENFDVSSTISINDPNNPVINVPLNHRSTTLNQLYGAQIGADLCIWDHGKLRVTGVTKAGLFGNAAHSSYNIALDNLLNLGGTFRNSQTAFVGELGINGLYRVTDHVAMHAGYQLLWLEGVAVATDQVPSVVGLPSGIDSNGGAFFHGTSAGIDVTW